MTGKRRASLRLRQDELRRRQEREEERAATLERLARGTASYEDLLRAVREGRFRTREEAQRAWGLL